MVALCGYSGDDRKHKRAWLPLSKGEGRVGGAWGIRMNLVGWGYIMQLWVSYAVPPWVRGQKSSSPSSSSSSSLWGNPPLRKTSVQHESSGAAASAAVRGRAREPGAGRGEGSEAVRQGVPQGGGLHLRGLPLEEGPLWGGRRRRWWDHLAFFFLESRVVLRATYSWLCYCSLIWIGSKLCSIKLFGQKNNALKKQKKNRT